MSENCANCVIGKTSEFSGQFCPSCASLLAEEAYNRVTTAVNSTGAGIVTDPRKHAPKPTNEESKDDVL